MTTEIMMFCIQEAGGEEKGRKYIRYKIGRAHV